MTPRLPVPKSAGSPSGLVRGGLRTVLGVYLLLSAWIAWRSTTLAPYSDMLDWLARYDVFRRNHDLAAYLLVPHNFHRLVWTFGLIALDARSFGAQGCLLPITSALGLALGAALLAREAARAAPHPLRLAAAAVAAMLVLLSVNLLSVGLYIHASYIQAFVFAVLALVIGEAEEDGGKIFAWRRAAALAFAGAACFGNAAALVLWPILILAGWRFAAPRPWLAATIVVAVVFVALYLRGQAQAAATTLGAGGLWEALLFLLNFLGLPWTHAVPRLGWLLGAAVLALSVWAILIKGRSTANRSERLAVQFILFALGAAVLAALGRAETAPPEQVSVRYAIFLAPLHVGLLMLAAPFVGRLRERRPAVLDAAGLAVALLLLTQQVVSGPLVIAAADADRRMVADFKAGVRTPDMVATIHPDLAHAAAIYERLRREGIYQSELHLPPTRGRAG